MRFLPRLPFVLCLTLRRLSCPLIPTVLPCLAPSSDIDRFQQVHQSDLMTCLSFDLYFQLLLVTSATSDPFHPCLSSRKNYFLLALTVQNLLYIVPSSFLYFL